MQKRPYGTTGIDLSIVGFGGIVVKGVTAKEADRDVGWSIDQGINYFDVAPGYGNAQDMLGPALEPYRDGVFLACKTTKRDAVGARTELENSLRLLRTDHFDLYQMHSMKSQEDLDQAMGPGGALETFVAAREQGLVRYLGFSAHSAEVALDLMDLFEFDSTLFPVNWVNYFESGFGPQVVDKAVRQGVAVLALKAMAHYKLADGQARQREKCWYHPIEDPELAALGLRFALSQPIVAALPPGDPELFRMGVEIARDFTPITPEETAEIKAQAMGRAPIFELAAV